MVIASNDFKTVTRNSSQFKVIPQELLNPERNQETQEDGEETENQDEMAESLRRSNRQRKPPSMSQP
jgi:hypothetical protein